jgi:hypothetical protein
MSQTGTFTIRAGDQLPTFRATLVDDTGAVANLQSATAVRFHMRSRRGGAAKVDAPATVLDALNGRVAYAWALNDTDEPGVYGAEIEVTWPDDKAETFPNHGSIRVYVTSQLDSIP